MSEGVETVRKEASHNVDYLDKVFRQPKFVWNDGQCDLDLLYRDVTSYHAGRAQLLASTLQYAANTQEPQPDMKHTPKTNEPVGEAPVNVPVLSAPAPETTPAKSPVKPSIVTAIATRSAVVPLISDVWNASEPINYVRIDFAQ